MLSWKERGFSKVVWQVDGEDWLNGSYPLND